MINKKELIIQPYFIFISYKSGNHYNCLCKDEFEMMRYVTEELKGLGLSITKKELNNFVKDDERDDHWISNYDNWITITKIDDYSIKQMINLIIDLKKIKENKQ